MRCINIYGLETENETPVCSWVKPVGYYIDTLKKEVDLDTVRIPFSYDLVSCGSMAKLDTLVNECTTRGMNVILDFHRVRNSHQSPAPDAEIPLDLFIEAWRNVLLRYAGNPKVVGVGVFNEFQSDDVARLSRLHTTIVNQLEIEFPGRFHYYLGGTSWGASIAGLDTRNLTTGNWSYEIHTYGFSNMGEQEWLQKSGVLSKKNIFVGEWGFTKQQYEYGRRSADLFRKSNITDVCFWTIAHSWDTGGLWEDDCVTMDTTKLGIFKSVFTKPRPALQCLRGSVR
jgi:aryl-phospho-beta-D-glucosidase BglC (GH1 family)